MASYDAILIGGGHNGLITAALLAKAGLSVLVLERRNVLGGAAVTEEIAGAPGFQVSTGAAQLGNLRPDIVEDLELARFGYELLLPDPLSVFLFPDAEHLALWGDPERTRREFAKHSRHDAAALAEFQQDCASFCDVLEPLLDGDPVPSLGQIEAAFADIRRPDLYSDFMIGSIAAVLDSRFESEAVKAVLGFTGSFGTNAGPRDAGTAYVMAHHLFGATTGVRGRTGYVRGGMGGLADALSEAARHHGAVLRTGATVRRVLIAEETARGVELEDGERIGARVVISNADPRRTFLHMVGPSRLPAAFTTAIRQIEMRGVALKVNCALGRLPRFATLPEGLVPARIGICPSLDAMDAAWRDARRGRPARAPFMTVHMQSAIDPSLAPDGRHSLTCYAHYFPYDLDPALGTWEQQRGPAGDRVLDVLAAYAPDIHDILIRREVMSPLDIEHRFAMTGGHQFHGDMVPPTLFDQRPAPGCTGARTPVTGLYLCGAGAHPGGCVWGAPGLRASRAVLNDFRKNH